jgi:hypothetical protein
MLVDDASNHFCPATGSERNNDNNWACQVGLRLGQARGSRQRSGACGQM